MKNDNFYLFDLTDAELQVITNLSDIDVCDYIHNLICNYYSHVDQTSEQYRNLVKAYKTSFILETIYRSNPLLSNNFTTIYTRTGLIRELVNDLYHIGPEKVVFQ